MNPSPSNSRLKRESKQSLDHLFWNKSSEETIAKKIRPITPVPKILMSDLPSPRGKGRGAINTFNLLPFFQED